jgi:hypothetical protein
MISSGKCRLNIILLFALIFCLFLITTLRAIDSSAADGEYFLAILILLLLIASNSISKDRVQSCINLAITPKDVHVWFIFISVTSIVIFSLFKFLYSFDQSKGHRFTENKNQEICNTDKYILWEDRGNGIRTLLGYDKSMFIQRPECFGAFYINGESKNEQSLSKFWWSSFIRSQRHSEITVYNKEKNSQTSKVIFVFNNLKGE